MSSFATIRLKGFYEVLSSSTCTWSLVIPVESRNAPKCRALYRLSPEKSSHNSPSFFVGERRKICIFAMEV
nr:MAG TPA: hypothetical protein [Caudoviricetes sp.]DAX80753.1 MAG TPA: hypothetical protein [Caudoviricetes sp.]